jgi:ketosteroid isomerase-like protein
MRRQYEMRNVYWFTLLLVFGFLAACSEPVPDETRLRQAIAQMEKAAEAKQTGPILDYLADDFLGNKVYRKVNIRAMLLLHYRQNQHIHVYLRIAELTIQGQQAKLTCQVILAGRGEKLVPERGRVLVIHSNWQKRDGEWRLVKAHWRDPLLQP